MMPLRPDWRRYAPGVAYLSWRLWAGSPPHGDLRLRVIERVDAHGRPENCEAAHVDMPDRYQGGGAQPNDAGHSI